MNSYSYKNGILGAETDKGWVDLSSRLASVKFSAYIYNLSSIKKRTSLLQNSLKGLDARLHYAMKANAHPEILKSMQQSGCGVDVVSMGEAEWALKNGFKAQDIIFSGVGKSKEELTFAVEKQLFQVNTESLEEIRRLGGICKSKKQSCNIGIRLNPNIKVDTHPYITTGFRENKFGISEYQIGEALELIKTYQPWLQLKGLSSHIGSQIRDLTPILDAVLSLLKTGQTLKTQGFDLTTLDIGGGLGIDYSTDDESAEMKMIETFGAAVQDLCKDFRGRLMLEPGRVLVGRSGVLCARVEYVKHNGYKNFLILNSGMNHLMRPALYKAFHRIQPVKPTAQAQKLFDVVGPICESSDVLGHDRLINEPQENDWMAIMDAGAYGMSMSSNYNHHPLPEEIII